MCKLYFKRLLDFLIVLTALLLIWPILLLIIIFLHFANKGAGVFFTQDRTGKDARIFKAIKFKTMRDERDAEGNLYEDIFLDHQKGVYAGRYLQGRYGYYGGFQRR